MDDREHESAALGRAPALDELELQFAERRALARVLGTPPEPLRVARFELDGPLASGGMGTVWRARDPELDRPVAIKFMRGEGGELGARRMLEEAQALARVSHPNVIPIFDVGRHEGRVWLAMELVPGRTLRAWIREREPSPRERLAAWIDAGRGLAAVHELGLVHRDVKPDNVLIGDDGRVRLIDFGLVRGVEARGETERSDAEPSETDELDPIRTRTGAFLGTRAYAAPEQLRGEGVDARADQYAFCVSVWESLTGARPGEATSDAGRMPRRVRVALARGLASEPARRFASIDALLAELAPRRARWLVPAALLLAAGGGLGFGLLRPGAAVDAPVDPCADSGAALDRAWSERERATTLAALDSDPDAREQVAASLAAWTQRWRDAARTSCVEVHVERARAPSSLEPRRACLDDRLMQLRVVARSIAAGPAGDGSPTRLLAALDDPAACLSPAVLARRPEPDPADQREQLASLRERLFGLRIGADGRPLAERRARAERLLADVLATGSPALEASAVEVLAELAREAGDLAASRRHVGAVFDHAQRLDDRELLARAWSSASQLALELELDDARALWFGERERAAVRELGDPPQALARALSNRGRAELLGGRLDAAEADMREAAAAFERAGPTQAWARAAALRNLATILTARGRTGEALALLEQAAALESTRPRDRGRASDLGLDAYTEALTLLEAGELERVEAPAERALSRYRAQQGPRSSEVAEVHTLLASLYERRGLLDRAREQIDLAERIYRELDPQHRDRFHVLSVRGILELREGDTRGAVESFALALRLAHSFDPSERALARANLGEALLADGAPREAELELRAAIDALILELGPEHPALAIPRKALGAALLAQDQAEAARELLELARASLAAEADNPVELAQTRWLAAQASEASGERPRAVELARVAAQEFAELGPDFAETHTQILTWLAERADSTPTTQGPHR